MKYYFFISFVLSSTFLLNAQVSQEWVAIYDGYAGYVNGITVDNEGNVYITGDDYLDTFDTGCITVKYNSAGVQQWVSMYDGAADEWDKGVDVTVDNSGNVYVAATINATMTGTNEDIAVIKYDSTGAQQWVVVYNSPTNSDDLAFKIALDDSNNIYVLGGNSTEEQDYRIIKYNQSGVEQWVAIYNGAGNDYDLPNDMVVDSSGNIYLTGSTVEQGQIGNITTIKYNANGGLEWITYYANATAWGEGMAIALDNQGNVYVTGYYYYLTTERDYITIKYDAAGVIQWVSNYDGPGNTTDYDIAHDVVVDMLGNVYVTGWSEGALSDDYLTIKYNQAGIEQWTARYVGPDGSCVRERNHIMIDNSGNAYVAGRTNVNGASDYAIIKYSASGNEEWIETYNGVTNEEDVIMDSFLDSEGNLYVTGETGFYLDFATIKYKLNPESYVGDLNDIYGELTIYPNPTSSSFTIRGNYELPAVIELYDIAGRKIYRKQVTSNHQQIDVSELPAGLYIWSIGTARGKLVKQ